VLWPEVSALLDEFILGGRPDRLVHVRYRELIGRNWLTFAESPPRRALASDLARQALGVPPHDLRTLAADYLRRHDPASAAALVSAHLGHGTEAAGADYSVLCEGAAASRTWREARRRIGAGNAPGTPRRRAS
jgi:integrase